MTKTELNAYRNALQNKRAALIYGSRGRAVLEATPDGTAQMTGGQEREVGSNSMNRNATLLDDVRAALERTESGGFGICVDCGREIAVQRLTAMPWVTCCVVCQEAADSRTVQPWDSSRESIASATW